MQRWTRHIKFGAGGASKKQHKIGNHKLRDFLRVSGTPKRKMRLKLSIPNPVSYQLALCSTYPNSRTMTPISLRILAATLLAHGPNPTIVILSDVAPRPGLEIA